MHYYKLQKKLGFKKKKKKKKKEKKKAIRGFEPISYRGGLLSTALYTFLYVFYTIC
jgi:hypothetical protein